MRRELTTAFAAMAALIAIAFLVPLGLSARNTARDRALGGGRAEAAGLVPLVAGGQAEAVGLAIDELNRLGRHQVTAVMGGQLLGAPIASPARTDQALADAASSTGPADGGVELVTAVAGPGGTSAVRVLVLDDELQRGVLASWLALAATGLALILVSVAVGDRIAQRAVRPAQQLADAAHRLGQGDLEVSVEPSGPIELLETATAFNRLTGQIRTMLAGEREMVSELTHRLRTPLTRLRIDLDQVTDPTLAAELHRDVDDLTAEVNDLIAQARRTAHPPIPIDVAAVAADRYEFWSALAVDEDRPCRLTIVDGPAAAGHAGSNPTRPVLAAVDPDDLAAALDVLFENVFAHTDRGTAFELTVHALAGGCAVTLDDAGTGFDPALAQAGRSGAGSTGLGLSIVERLARSTGGSMEIAASPLGGAQIRCRLGQANLAHWMPGRAG